MYHMTDGNEETVDMDELTRQQVTDGDADIHEDGDAEPDSDNKPTDEDEVDEVEGPEIEEV